MHHVSESSFENGWTAGVTFRDRNCPRGQYPGVSIQNDDGNKANFPVERCEPDGCRAGMKLRDATIEQLIAGNRLTITFHDGERQPITVPLSLDGFGESYRDLSEDRH